MVPFNFHGDLVTAEFTPSRYHCGFDGVVHGGILFALADEAMMHLIQGNEIKEITSEITIRMVNFARADSRVNIAADSLQAGRHLVTCKAVISNDDGITICKATGKFLYYTEDQPFKKSGL